MEVTIPTWFLAIGAATLIAQALGAAAWIFKLNSRVEAVEGITGELDNAQIAVRLARIETDLQWIRRNLASSVGGRE
jgi:hypothetical protein